MFCGDDSRELVFHHLADVTLWRKCQKTLATLCAGCVTPSQNVSIFLSPSPSLLHPCVWPQRLYPGSCSACRSHWEAKCNAQKEAWSVPLCTAKQNLLFNSGLALSRLFNLSENGNNIYLIIINIRVGLILELDKTMHFKWHIAALESIDFFCYIINITKIV